MKKLWVLLSSILIIMMVILSPVEAFLPFPMSNGTFYSVTSVGTSSLATVSTTNLLTADGTFATNTGWTVGTGWAIGSGVATHTAGNAVALSAASTATSTSKLYQINFSIYGTVYGDIITVSLGGTTWAGNWATIFDPATLWGWGVPLDATIYIRPSTNSGTFAITPGPLGTFAGTIDNVTIYEVIPSVADAIVRASDGSSVPMEIRGGGSGRGNVCLGEKAGENSPSSSSGNVGIGRWALQYATHSIDNIAIGTSAMRYYTGHEALFGTDNIAIGPSSLLYTQGNYNVGLGVYSLGALLFADGNTSMGAFSGRSITTGTYNTFLGYNAGYNASQKVDATNCTAIGYGAYCTASNQVVIGNTDVTETILKGDVKMTSLTVNNLTPVSATIVVKGSDGNDCNLVLTSGIITSTTCP